MSEKKSEQVQRLLLSEQEITPNQANFDIKYYALDLIPNPTTSILIGTVKVVGEVLSTSLDHIELNFWDDMIITDLYSTKAPESILSYTRNNDILSIDLDAIYAQGEQFNLVIAYIGHPQNSPYYSFDFDVYNNRPIIWTLSQPYGARAWWPCKDVPSDKADSVDIRITIPNGFIAASNGKLRETAIEGSNTTYWWHEQYPIVPYLVSLAIYPYTVYSDWYIYGDNDSMEVQFYVFPDHYNLVQENYAKTVAMIEYYSEVFGQYPFIKEKYGHAEFIWGGGMEHQTITSLGGWSESLIAHELAHQWWGDMVTCNSFNHIWLNEGFATYCEALWFEHIYGQGVANDYQMDYNLYLGSGTVYVEDPLNENIFDVGLSYNKGSWILHMLRYVVGDDVFFNILKTYYESSHQYGTVTTEEFQIICEQLWGKSLDKFFHQWIYEEYFPRFSYSWEWNHNGDFYDIQLDIRQAQTNHIFWIPMDVTVTTVTEETTFVILDSLQSQSFQLSVPSEPKNIELDRDNWVLKLIEDNITDPTFDKGILLVNGVSFDTYGAEIFNAYTQHAFWGDFPISFWDCFDTPTGGYPATLPDPLGHGRIPSDILKQFSSVIWIGNNYGGDLDCWYHTAIMSYINTGGNMILITRRGQDFINYEMQQYLGMNWAEGSINEIQNCISTFPGLQNINLSGIQNYIAVFDTTLLNEQSTVLFTDTSSFDTHRGLGVWSNPQTNGKYRTEGGQFILINGRPYRFNSSQLRVNIEYILENFFAEQKSTKIAESATDILPKIYKLNQNYPNPFNPSTTISYQLPVNSKVDLSVYNILGQKVVTLISERQPAGYHTIDWNASAFASGVYYYRLKIKDSSGSDSISGKAFIDTKKLVLLR